MINLYLSDVCYGCDQADLDMEYVTLDSLEWTVERREYSISCKKSDVCYKCIEAEKAKNHPTKGDEDHEWYK